MSFHTKQAELSAPSFSLVFTNLTTFIVPRLANRRFRGYLGTTIIASGGNNSSVRYVINRFADQASLDAWENSEVALSLLQEVNKYSTLQRVTGLETWFNLPDLKTIGAPPKWKMAIVSFIAAYSISLVAHYILSICWQPSSL